MFYFVVFVYAIFSSSAFNKTHYFYSIVGYTCLSLLWVSAFLIEIFFQIRHATLRLDDMILVISSLLPKKKRKIL